MIISVVVIAFNEQANLKHCITAILHQTTDCELDVVIVNDGSTDTTLAVAEQLRHHNAQVRVVDLGANRGRGAARAAGVQVAVGDLIAFIDADIIVPPHWLSVCLEHLETVAACGGTAVPDGDVAWTHRAFSLQPKAVAHTITVTGSNGLFRRDVFDLVPFDPSLRQGEDVALNRGMERHGLTTKTIPGLLVEHHESKTFAQSTRWLFVSGVGASRHLLAHRRIRTPDLAFGGFAALLAAVVPATVADPGWAAAAGCTLVAYVLLASAAHLSGKFWLGRAPMRSATATVAHAALLVAYFAGRGVGLLPVHRTAVTSRDGLHEAHI